MSFDVVPDKRRPCASRAPERGCKGCGSFTRDPSPSNGRPLETTTRQAMEASFGHDFGGVRVHTGGDAADAARAEGAHAYSYGQHVVFGEDRYAPGSRAGQRLLAHELAHVVQQGNRPAAAPLPFRPGTGTSALEREADTAADDVLAGRRPVITQRAPVGTVQRQAATTADPETSTAPISLNQPENDWALRPPPEGLPQGVSIERHENVPLGDNKVGDAELLREPNGRALLTVNIRTWFVFMNDDEAWTLGEQRRWQDEFIRKVGDKWSNKHYLEPYARPARSGGAAQPVPPDVPQRVPVRVRCVPVAAGSPHHVAVTVWRDKPGGRSRSHVAGDTMRVRASDIESNGGHVTAEHEFGHSLGIGHISCDRNDDECYGRGDAASDIMGSGPTVSARDYQVFANLMTEVFFPGTKWRVLPASAPPRNILPLILGATFGTLLAVAGGVIGAMAGGPLGAFLGAGIGMLVGGLAGYGLGQLGQVSG